MKFGKYIAAALLLSAGLTANADDKTVVFHSGGNPDAPYTPAIQHGNTLYMSGQLGRDAKGKLPEGVAAQTHNAMKRIKTLVETHGSSMDRVVKCTVFLADIAEWGDFNKVYMQYFKPGHRPARSALGVGGLALNARVEIECIAAMK